MKFKSIIAILLCSIVQINISAQKLDWVADFKTPTDSYAGISETVSDGQGGLYVLASAHTKVNLISDTGGLTELAVTDDAYRGYNLILLNKQGDKVFDKLISIRIGENSDGIFSLGSMVADDQGNIFIGGIIIGPTEILINDSNIPIIQNTGERKRALILKIDRNGSLLSHKIIAADKQFYHRFFSMDYSQGKLYILSAIVDEAISSGDENLLTETVSVYNENWDLLKEKSFSGRSRNTGGGGDARKQFMMSKIMVDDGQVYLSGVIQNGQGSDLDHRIVTDNPAMVSSVIKLNAELEFLWFRGVQGYITSSYETGLSILDNGDLVLNSFVYSYGGFPTSLVGSDLDKRSLPEQLQYSARQLFFSPEGEFKFQTVVNGTNLSALIWTDGLNVYLPFATNNIRDLIVIGSDGVSTIIYPKKESGASTNYQGYLKISNSGQYQDHNIFRIEAEPTYISQIEFSKSNNCESFFITGRYSNDSNNGIASFDVNFDNNQYKILTNSNNTSDSFIASYSNQTPKLNVNEDHVYRSGNEIVLPVSIIDESPNSVVFSISSSDDTVIPKDSYRLVIDDKGSRLRITQIEGATGSTDLQLQLIDPCGSTDESNITIDLNRINDVPVFDSEPVTMVDESGYYEYEVKISDPDGDALALTSVNDLPDGLSFIRASSQVGENFAGGISEGKDDGMLNEATFSFPTDLVKDSKGNFFVTDSGLNGSIRKITPDGQVITFVGRNDSSNPDGVGTQAGIAQPRSIAIDSQDNLYIAEGVGKKIRKVTSEGVVTTFATFSISLDGIAVNGDNEVFVVSAENGLIYKVDAEGNVSQFAGGGSGDGQGSEAGFNSPTSLVFDKSGNLYVGERLANGIRKVTPEGIVTTPIQFSVQRTINGIEVDTQGNVYIGSGPFILRVSDKGSDSVFAKFHADAYGLYLNNNQELLYADFARHGIKKAYEKGTYQLKGTANPRDGKVEVVLAANDGNGGISTQSFQIKVDIKAPIFTSPENHQISENIDISDAVYAAGSQDESEVTYSLGNGHDEALFNMRGQYTNAVYFNQSPDFETPLDSNGDNIYVFEIIATDKGGNSSSLIVNLTVNNLNESDPIITTDPNWSIDENVKEITVIEATGVEEGFGINWTLSGGVDRSAFNLDGDGKLSFRNTPDYEFPTDSNKDNVYEIEVTAFEGNRRYPRLFFIRVNDVVESLAPIFISDPVTTVVEGNEYSYPILTSDPDNDNVEINLLNAPDWLTLDKDRIQVSTFAGSGDSGSGSEGNRLVAGFNRPNDIVIDGNNQLYILERARVRKIDQRGEVTTLAGTGGFGAVNGNGNQASFREPQGIAIDNTGNIYVADAGNYLIRKITPDGFVSTFAGSGSYAFADGTGTEASFLLPSNIAIDASDNLYVADLSDNRIRKITPEGVVSVFAGTGINGFKDGVGINAEFYGPIDLAFDSQGNLFVAEFYNARIRKITPEGVVSTFAGNGTKSISDGRGEEASFHSLRSINIDMNDVLYVSDMHMVRKITPEGEVTTLAGASYGSFQEGVVPNVQFRNPNGVAFDDHGNIYVADEFNHRIRKISKTSSLTGTPEGVFGEFEIELKVGDGEDGENTQKFTLSVLDIEAPVFTSSGVVNVAENTLGVVYTAEATDKNTLTYSLEDVQDVNSFNINASNGELSLKTAPNFEAPMDSDQDNIYNVKVKVSDGTNAVSQPVTINVLNINDELPVFTSSPILTVADNTNYTYDVFGSDPDASATTISSTRLPEWLTLTSIPQGVVSTLAGTVRSTLKDGQGLQASFNQPSGLAIDKQGNIYLADRAHHRIVKITPSGEATTFAGLGIPGFKDGNSLEASFNNPWKLAVDSKGNVFVIDATNRVIRKIDVSGNVSTFAGSGRSELIDGVGVEASFSFPLDITIDASDNLYVTDLYSVRKIDPEGRVLTIAGGASRGDKDGIGTEAQFSFLTAITIDVNGTLYVAELSRGIRKISPDLVVSKFVWSGSAGFADGTGAAASFARQIDGMTVGPDGNIYVADAGNRRIRKVTMSGEVSTYAGSGQTGDQNGVLLSAQFDNPRGIVFGNSGELFVSDYNKGNIRKVGNDALVTTFAGGDNTSFKDGVSSEADFDLPSGLAIDNVGNIFVADAGNHAIRKIGIDGQVSTLAGNGIAGFKDGNQSEASLFNSPNGLDVDSQGNVYVADKLNHSIRKITPDGVVSTIAGSGNIGYGEGVGSTAHFSEPLDVAVAKNGDIYVADSQNNRIRKVSSEGTVSTFIGNGSSNDKDGPKESAVISYPFGITIDKNGNLFVIDGAGRIRKVDAQGNVSTFAGGAAGSGRIDGMGTEARFIRPTGLAIDINGNIFVSEGWASNVIRKVSPDGRVTTLAGSGTNGLNDGSGMLAYFNSPLDVAIDKNGDIIVADSENHKIRKVSAGSSVLSGSAVGQGGSHNVRLKLTDAGGASTTQDFTITVIDVTKPVFTSSGLANTPENSNGVVYTAKASDTNTLTYSLEDVQDAALFSINPLTGELSFKAAPDFEVSTDANKDNIYNLVVKASDGVNTASETVVVTVSDIDEILPVFTSATAVNFEENATGTAYTIIATDLNTVTYSLGTGNDESFFNLAGGVVTFKESPDLETKSSYTIQVNAKDGLNTASQTVVITITDIDEIPPVFTSAAAANFKEKEKGTVYTIVATDANAVTYGLGTGNDEDLFNVANGVVTFKTTPDFETPKDANADNVYMIEILASDGLNIAKQVIAITIIDVDEVKPIATITSNTSNTVFSQSLKVQLKFSEPINGLESSDFELTNATISGLVGSDDSYSFNLQSILDGETKVSLKANTVQDAAGNFNDKSTEVIRLVEARNESPTSLVLSANVIDENTPIGSEIGVLSTTDVDINDQHTYSLINGTGDTDNINFSILGNKLISNKMFDFESTQSLSIRMRVTDIRGGSFEEAKTITVNNVDEPLMNVSLITLSIDEITLNSLIFGKIRTNIPKTRSFEIQNTGTDGDLSITGITLPAGYSSSVSKFTLPKGEKRVVDITFNSSVRGIFTGNVLISSNVGSSTIGLSALAISNNPPIAVAPNTRVTQRLARPIKLRGYDPDGDPIEYEITTGPSLGTLTASSEPGEYSFVPNALSPEVIYQDEVKFKVVEKEGGLSSEEAIYSFSFNLADQAHDIIGLNVAEPSADNLSFSLTFEDKVINNSYQLTASYYNPANRSITEIASQSMDKNSLSINGDQAVVTFGTSKADHAALFESGRVALILQLTTANGFSDSDVFFFERTANGVTANTVNNIGSDDGNYTVFATRTSTPENVKGTLNLYALELGDFSLSDASISITQQPLKGVATSPVLISNTGELASWQVEYNSETEVGFLDSLQFSVSHPSRSNTLSAYAKIEVIEVPDAPDLQSFTNTQMLEDGQLTLPISATDPDSELSISATSSDNVNVPVTIVDGALKVSPIANYNGIVTISVIATEQGVTVPQIDSESFQLTVSATNDAPAVKTITDQNINEDGQLVLTLEASDVDANAEVFAFSLSTDQSENISYEIIGNQLTITPKSDYFGEIELMVQADDQSGTSTSLSTGETFKLSVIPVNDAPEISKSLETQSLLEGFPEYSLDLAQFFKDKELEASKLEYTFTSVNNVELSLSGSVLGVSSKTGSTGIETAQVSASDGEFSVSQSITFITAASSTELSVTKPLTDLVLNEDFGSVVISLNDIFAYSANSNATFNYSLAGNQSLSAIVNNGKIEISSSENFNGADQLFVIASVDGKSTQTSFKITVNPVNDAPSLVNALTDLRIAEDLAFGQIISTSRFSDADGDALTYSATFSADWLSFNAETNTLSGTPANKDVGTVEVIITATDPSGATASDTFQISVFNTNDNPSDILMSASTFSENISLGTAIANLTGIDPDIGDTVFSYELVPGTGDTDNSSFEITNEQLRTTRAVDFEDKSSYTVRIRITDGFEGTYEKVINLTVNDINEVSTAINVPVTVIAENQDVGSIISSFTTTDPDTGDIHTYSLVSGEGDVDNNSFDIVDGKLVTKVSFDFEQRSSYSIRLQSMDAGGLSIQQVFTIHISDTNDQPTLVSASTLTIEENESIGTVVGEFTTVDQDFRDTHTYSLVSGEGDTDNSAFVFDGSKLTANELFNYETKSKFDIRVQSNDGKGGVIESKFQVEVTNVLEVTLKVDDSIVFSGVTIGESESIDLIINNDGEDELVITNVQLPEGYTSSFNTVVVGPSASEQLTISFVPTEAKVYEGVITILSNAGSNDIDVTGEGQLVTSIEAPKITDENVKLYPNPASRYVEIDLSELNGMPVEISLASIRGVEVWGRKNVKESKVVVDISTFQQGAYLVLIKAENGYVVKRLLIKK